MLATLVDPHRFGLARPFETERAVKIDGATIGSKDHLVERCIFSKKRPHHCAANSMPVKVWMNKHVRKIYDEMSVRYCISKTD